MVYCTRCGTEIGPGQSFCTNCGERSSMVGRAQTVNGSHVHDPYSHPSNYHNGSKREIKIVMIVVIVCVMITIGLIGGITYYLLNSVDMKATDLTGISSLDGRPASNGSVIVEYEITMTNHRANGFPLSINDFSGVTNNETLIANETNGSTIPSFLGAGASETFTIQFSVPVGQAIYRVVFFYPPYTLASTSRIDLNDSGHPGSFVLRRRRMALR